MNKARERNSNRCYAREFSVPLVWGTLSPLSNVDYGPLPRASIALRYWTMRSGLVGPLPNPISGRVVILHDVSAPRSDDSTLRSLLCLCNRRAETVIGQPSPLTGDGVTERFAAGENSN